MSSQQTVQPSLTPINVVWDRLQTTVFFVQETILSILYIWQTRKYLRELAPLLEASQSSITSAAARAKNDKTKTLLHHLLYINVLIISLDVALLGVQYANLFYLQGAFKPAIYGVKLKLEFVILNRLIKSIERRNVSTVHSDVRRVSSSDAGGISLTRGGWNIQRPSSGPEDERQLKPLPHVAHHQSSAEYLGDARSLHIA